MAINVSVLDLLAQLNGIMKLTCSSESTTASCLYEVWERPVFNYIIGYIE